MSRLDDIASLYEMAEYREATLADIPYLLRIARVAEVIAKGMETGDQDDLDSQLEKLSKALKAKVKKDKFK